MTRSHFSEGVSEQGDVQKDSFPKDGVRRVVALVHVCSLKELLLISFWKL